MVGKAFIGLVLIPLLFLFGCLSQMESDSVDLLSTFDFESGIQEWEGGISDYPVDSKETLTLSVDYDPVPSNSLLDGNGPYVSADNPHGDLFYFFKRKVEGLIPNMHYKLDFEFLIYTQLQNLSKDISSEDLYLKIGAVDFEPKLEQVTWRNSLEYDALNVDKGILNSDSGEDLINIGSIKQFTSDQAELISGNTFDFQIDVKTNTEGKIWLIIGVDSGIKSQLTFGLAALTVYYREQN